MRKDIKKLEEHHDTLPTAYEYFLNETQEDRRYRLREHNNIFKFDDLEFTLLYVTRTKDNYPLITDSMYLYLVLCILMGLKMSMKSL